MDRLTIFGIACGACVAVVIIVYLVDRRRQLRVRREMRSLLNEYFDEEIPVEQLGDGRGNWLVIASLPGTNFSQRLSRRSSARPTRKSRRERTHSRTKTNC